MLGAGPAVAAAVPIPHPRPQTGAAKAPSSSDGVTDLSRAVPLRNVLHRPPTADQFRVLKTQIAKDQPAVNSARTASETLAKQAESLQRKLVATAARVEALEQEKMQLDSEIARLTAENDRLSASFAHDRVAVSRLLAVLERLQHDAPPAMAMRPDDSLAAARGAMLIGASLPGVYGEASGLARRLEALRRTRAALVDRRAEAARNASFLAQARIELDQLLAMKRLEAAAAATHYQDLKEKLDIIAAQAVNLEALLARVAQLRSAPVSQSVVTVNAEDSARRRPGDAWLLCPVVGLAKSGGFDGVGGSSAPGLTYLTAPSARVVSPADGTVVFAGTYHRGLRVLILQMADGYDAVLAGLDRFDVRPDDHVLAGEPVGMMSGSSPGPRLYFELRQNGRGMNPAPYIAVALRKRL